MADFRKGILFGGRFTRIRLSLRGAAALLAVACPLALATVVAEEPPVKKVKPTAPVPAARATVQSEAAAIPECLEKLKLSAEQREQVTEIIRGYDESRGIVWKQFGERYMQTIATETSMLAAIEDHLTEAQRQQVRAQRHKTAKYEKSNAGTSTKANQLADKKSENPSDPTSAADEGLATVGVSLTDEQEAAADKIQEKYRPHLRSLNRDIQGLHTRLLSLEADKLVEIEKVLTKDQIAQLRTMRQNAPDVLKMALRHVELETKE